MTMYIHGTNALVVELWKKLGIPEGTYFGDPSVDWVGKKGIRRGINPVVDATFRNTSWDRDDVFDSICGVFERFGIEMPDDAAEKYETPVVVVIEGNGDFTKDPRGEYMVLSPRIEDRVARILKIDPESNFKERAKAIADTPLNSIDYTVRLAS